MENVKYNLGHNYDCVSCNSVRIERKNMTDFWPTVYYLRQKYEKNKLTF